MTTSPKRWLAALVTGVVLHFALATPGSGAAFSTNYLSLRLVAADSSPSYLFDSRNFGTAASRPLFTIEAVPEPGTTALGSLGITLLAGWRTVVRRRIA